jgi:hypothetical protein
MATFVNAVSTQNSNTFTLGSVVSGNLLIFFYEATGGTPTSPSGTQSDWKAVAVGVGSIPSWLYWTIATSSGTHTVTMGGTGSNQGGVFAQYSGSDAVGVLGFAIQNLGAGVTVISCGPFVIRAGALVCVSYLAQATAYASTSGSTNRTAIDNVHRVFLADNLAQVGSYTETGNLTGAMAFGGTVILASIGRTGNTRTLVGVGT